MKGCAVLTLLISCALALELWIINDLHFYKNEIEIGNYEKDAPLMLVESGLTFIKKHAASDSIVIYGGDASAHVPIHTQEDTFSYTKIAADLFNKHISQRIVPVIGNHDFFPVSQTCNTDVYILWSKIWSIQNNKTYERGGYFTSPLSENIDLIIVNTNLYYFKNKCTVNDTDPAGQFTWLDETLSLLKQSKKRAVIVGHVPPGTLESNNSLQWFQSKFNDAYVDVIQKHCETILVQLFFHEHTDTFRIVRNSDGDACSVLMINPSLSPMHLPVVGMTGINPSIRKIKVDTEKDVVLSYDQYYLDYASATSDDIGSWKHGYSSLEIPELSTGLNVASSDKLYKSLHNNPKSFDFYLQWNNANYYNSTKQKVHWNDMTRKLHTCSISQIPYVDFTKCLAENKFI